MRLKLIAGLLVAVALTGATSECNLDPNVLTPQQVKLAAQTYNTAVSAGNVYLRLPLCSATAPSPCRTQPWSQTVYASLLSGRAARNQLLAEVAANQTLDITLIQTLQASYSVLSNLPH